MNLKNRQIIERVVINYLVEQANLHGWSIMHVDDGEERVPIDRTEGAGKTVAEQVADVVFSVDECRIRFAKLLQDEEGGTVRVGHTAFIVLGNSGWDCICDHSLNSNYPDDNFEALMKHVDKFTEQFEEIE